MHFPPFIHTYSIYSSKHWKAASLPRYLHLARRACLSCADVQVSAKLHFLDPSVYLLESVPVFNPQWGQANGNISIGVEKGLFQGHAKTQDRWLMLWKTSSSPKGLKQSVFKGQVRGWGHHRVCCELYMVLWLADGKVKTDVTRVDILSP